MAYSQSELGRRFKNGATSGSASNLEIKEHEWGGVMLVAYGHAVYAYRSPEGYILVFRGWYNKENERHHAGGNNKCQFRRLGLSSMADEVIEGTDKEAAPKRRSFDPREWDQIKAGRTPIV